MSSYCSQPPGSKSLSNCLTIFILLSILIDMESLKSSLRTLSDNANLFIMGGFFVRAQSSDTVIVDSGPAGLGFEIPNFSMLLTFMIRFFFVLAGISALLYLLWGSLDWITSGGEKDKVEKARGKIASALIGVIVIVATLSIIWTFENVVFKKALCFGISCPMTLPVLLKKT